MDTDNANLKKPNGILSVMNVGNIDESTIIINTRNNISRQ